MANPIYKNPRALSEDILRELNTPKQAVFIHDLEDDFAKKYGYYPHEKETKEARDFFTQNPHYLETAPFSNYDDIDKYRKDDEYAKIRAKHYLEGATFDDASKLAHDAILQKYGGK